MMHGQKNIKLQVSGTAILLKHYFWHNFPRLLKKVDFLTLETLQDSLKYGEHIILSGFTDILAR